MKKFWKKVLVIRRADVEIEPEEIFMDSVNSPGFRHEMQEGRIERPIARLAFSVLGAVMALGIFAILGRLADLNILKGDKLLEQSDINKTYPIVISAPRGIFYDRAAVPLVENIPTFVISLKTAAISGDDAFARVLANVSAILGKNVSDIAEANGLAPGAGSALYRRSSWPREIFIASGELRSQVLEIRSRADEFSGIVIAEGARRNYTLGSAGSHFLGYVGRPNKDDLSRLPAIRPGDVIGKDGLELWYEDALRGDAGEKIIETNASGEPLRERFVVKPEAGNDVILEIDSGLQQFAARALARHIQALGKRAGAIVAIDPRDGAVRALASYPDYDPNIFGAGLSAKEFGRIANNPAHPFINRAVSSGYPSGSTIKPIIAVSALEEQIIDPNREIYDPGYISVTNPYDPSRPAIFKDWKELGWVDMRRAIAMSANVYFYTVGGGYGDIKGLGIDRIRSWLERFGWGRALGIDLPGEYAGLIPGPDLKKITQPENPIWRIGDTYLSSIGQGDTQVTALQLAGSIAAIANGGTLWKPRIAKAIVDEFKNAVKEFPPAVLGDHLAGQESLAIVREGMRQAVTDGSSRALAGLPFPAAGKTGTAQTGVYGKNHGWFVGFAPYDNPEIVLAVLVEEGTGGSTDAVPIAKEVLYYYLTEKK